MAPRSTAQSTMPRMASPTEKATGIGWGVCATPTAFQKSTPRKPKTPRASPRDTPARSSRRMTRSQSPGVSSCRARARMRSDAVWVPVLPPEAMITGMNRTRTAAS